MMGSTGSEEQGSLLCEEILLVLRETVQVISQAQQFSDAVQSLASLECRLAKRIRGREHPFPLRDVSLRESILDEWFVWWVHYLSSHPSSHAEFLSDWMVRQFELILTGTSALPSDAVILRTLFENMKKEGREERKANVQRISTGLMSFHLLRG